jgi:hypothetical protein
MTLTVTTAYKPTISTSFYVLQTVTSVEFVCSVTEGELTVLKITLHRHSLQIIIVPYVAVSNISEEQIA